MLMHVDHSVLLLIDFQVRLQPAIHDATQVLEAGVWLTRLAQRLQVPVICTEQYPKGLGPTMPALRALLPDECVIEKLHFSAVAGSGLFEAHGGERAHFVVAGTEAHVCVQQTVLRGRRFAPQHGQGVGPGAYAQPRRGYRFTRNGGLRVVAAGG
jgi:nicotinamidase-related amidase